MRIVTLVVLLLRQIRSSRTTSVTILMAPRVRSW